MKDKISYYLERSVDGDMTAFSELYRMTFRRIYYICMNILKNSHDADDVIQETYFSAYRNLAKLDDKSKFSAWLERIAVNKCMDFLRKKTPELFDEPETVENISDGNNDVLPEQYVMSAEKRSIFMNIMRNSLSELQYRTVFLYYFNDFTVHEISVIMNCSEGAVKNRLSTARLKIKSGVENYQENTGDRLYAVPVLMKFFDEEVRNINIPDMKSSVIKSVPVKFGKAGINMLKFKLIAGTMALITLAGGTAVYFNGESKSISQSTVESYAEIPEKISDSEMKISENFTSSVNNFSVTTTILSTIDSTTTITTTSSLTTTTTTVLSFLTDTTTEIQPVYETVPEIVTDATEVTVSDIWEEPSQPITEIPEEYPVSDEINTYQERFFDYIRILNDSTYSMIEMSSGMGINDYFEGEEKERFMEFSSLADEYENKIQDLFDETEEIVETFENNTYYDFYIRAETDLAEGNYNAPEGTYVGAVQQWDAINNNYEKLLEYLYSELEEKLPPAEYEFINQYKTAWSEKHEYFLNNVIIHGGDRSFPSTGEFESRSRKYHCLMLMLYYCRKI